jgi:hypothetical protein
MQYAMYNMEYLEGAKPVVAPMIKYNIEYGLPAYGS